VIKKDGGTVNGSVLRSDWLDHSVTATATAPANLLSDEVSVFTESIDYLRFVPGDPSLLNTPATLRFRVTGLVEVTGEQKTFSSAWAQVHIRASWAHFKTWVIDTWASASEPQSITIDEVIQAPIVLGHWERSWPEVAVTVKARNGQTSTAKARFVYTPPLEVRNAAGQVVPLARICTASGKVY
jgi:hypothetical protein